jgi:acyl-coenzyme A synthetase/AMP-(fatty) acid ligase
MGSIPQLSIVKGKQALLYPQLLHRTFEEKVDKDFGEKTAMIYRSEDNKEEEERRTNYNTLNSSANRIASAVLDTVKTKNLQPNGDGDWIVAVCMKPTDHLVTTLLSIWKAGGKKS